MISWLSTILTLTHSNLWVGGFEWDPTGASKKPANQRATNIIVIAYSILRF